MKKLAELQQERASKVKAQKALLDKRKAEKRNFSEEESQQFNTLDDEIRTLDTEIEQRKREDEAEKRALELGGNPVDTTKGEAEEREKEKITKRFSIVKAIRQAKPGSKGLDGAEKEMHEIGIEESRSAGVDVPEDTNLSIPLSYITGASKRATAQTVSEDSGDYGGKLVQNQAPRMVEPLRPRLAFEDLGATFMSGLVGGDIPLIVDNDFIMTFLAETAAITPHKKTYDGPSLSPKRAGGAVDLSNRLLMQSSIDVDARVARGLRTGFQQLLHGACINGAGGVAPTGLLTYTGVNAAADVAAAAATWAKIVELQTLIEEDNATEESLGWLLHPKLKGKLKTIAKDAGSGMFLLEEKEIDGYRYISTTLVPVLDDGGTAVYPLIFGDFAQMVIGQWGSINVSINPYSADLSNSLRLVLNTYADMQIANPAAFAKNAFLTA